MRASYPELLGNWPIPGQDGYASYNGMLIFQLLQKKIYDLRDRCIKSLHKNTTDGDPYRVSIVNKNNTFFLFWGKL